MDCGCGPKWKKMKNLSKCRDNEKGKAQLGERVVCWILETGGGADGTFFPSPSSSSHIHGAGGWQGRDHSSRWRGGDAHSCWREGPLAVELQCVASDRAKGVAQRLHQRRLVLLGRLSRALFLDDSTGLLMLGRSVGFECERWFCCIAASS